MRHAANAEPVPEWPAAQNVWQWAWELHYIGFGVAFLFLVLWAVLAFLRARKTPLLLTRRFCYAINFLLILFGTTRAFALFLYPYEVVDHAGGTPVVIERILFGIGFPCLTAGFTLIHYAFLEVAKVRFSSRRIQNMRFIIGVIALHFILVIIAEIVTSFVLNTSILMVICMLYFIVCTLAVSMSVFYSGFKLVRQSKKHRRTLRRISLKSGNNATLPKGKTSPYSNKESNTAKVMRVTMVTAILGVTLACLQVYAMVDIFKVRANGIIVPAPWPWWSYQTVFRLVELGLACTMAYTVSQPKKKHERVFLGCCPLPMRSRAETFSDSGHTLSDSARYTSSQYV